MIKELEFNIVISLLCLIIGLNIGVTCALLKDVADLDTKIKRVYYISKP